jgi:hypothetical protein
MRRIVGLVLTGLGACLIVFAVLMPTYVSSRVLKFPLNEFVTSTLTDSNASYFSPVKLTEMNPVTMEVTYTLKRKADAGSGSTAVWNEFTYVYDQTNKVPFQTLTRTFAFDRHNAQLLNCCGANVNGDSSIRQSGIVGYVFPIGTKKQTYDVFDANVGKPVPFSYQGTDTVGGIQTYRFVENVPATQNGTQVVPGSAVGQTQASVTLPQFYQARVTYWIDPDTGVLLKANQDEKVFLEDSSGAQALLLFNANLVMNQSSVNSLVALDNTQRNKKSTVETVLPLATGIAGAVLLIIGLLLSRRPREDVDAPLAATAPHEAEAAPDEAQAASHDAEAASREAHVSLVPGLADQFHGEPEPHHREAAKEAVPEAALTHPDLAAADATRPEPAVPDAAATRPEPIAAEAPEAPEAAAPETLEAPEAPETPETPETPEAPEVHAAEESPAPEAPEAPEAQAPAAEEPESEATPPMPQRRRGVHRR